MLGHFLRRWHNIQTTLGERPPVVETPAREKTGPNYRPPFSGKRLCAVNIPVNKTRWHNAGLMLDQRRRRRPSIEPTLLQNLVFSGIP